MPLPSIRTLRAKLILEEALEFIRDAGFPDLAADLRSAELVSGWSISGLANLTKMVDACFDLRVVTTGTLSALGVPDDKGQDIVDEANLRKFAPPLCPRCGCQLQKDHKLWECHTPACQTEGYGTQPETFGPWIDSSGKLRKGTSFVGPDADLSLWLKRLSNATDNPTYSSPTK